MREERIEHPRRQAPPRGRKAQGEGRETVNAYCWIATAICLAGTTINVYRVNWCFAFWIVGEIMWVAFDVRQALMSRTILDLVGLALAAWGAWVNLVKPKIKTEKGERK